MGNEKTVSEEEVIEQASKMMFKKMIDDQKDYQFIENELFLLFQHFREISHPMMCMQINHKDKINDSQRNSGTRFIYLLFKAIKNNEIDLSNFDLSK